VKSCSDWFWKNNSFVFTNLLCNALSKFLLYKYCKEEAFVAIQFLPYFLNIFEKKTKNKKETKNYVLDIFALFLTFFFSKNLKSKKKEKEKIK
jgi:hypothetical protein